MAAPLPEERIKVEEDGRCGTEELERERRRIDDERWNAMKRTGVLTSRVAKEDILRFSELIKVENSNGSKKKCKVIYDLKDAIQLIKFWCALNNMLRRIMSGERTVKRSNFQRRLSIFAFLDGLSITNFLDRDKRHDLH